MTSSLPRAVLALRRRRRVDGAPFLVATVGERLVLEPGTELHLRRIRTGDDGDEPTHALQIIPPRGPWQPSKAVREQVAAGRLDGSAIRMDPRDRDVTPEERPW